MHDRAARPSGAVKSAAAIASETMILLNIDLRIAQVRPRVEESVQALVALIVFLLLFWREVVLSASGKTLDFRWDSGLYSIRKRVLEDARAFEVATGMLLVIMENSEESFLRRQL